MEIPTLVIALSPYHKGACTWSGLENTGYRRYPEQANVSFAVHGKSKIFLCVHIYDVPRNVFFRVEALRYALAPPHLFFSFSMISRIFLSSHSRPKKPSSTKVL